MSACYSSNHFRARVRVWGYFSSRCIRAVVAMVRANMEVTVRWYSSRTLREW